MTKKVFNLQAWRIDANGNPTEITSQFESDELKRKILSAIRGARFFQEEIDSTGQVCKRMTSAVVRLDGYMELYVYETNEQYLSHKNNWMNRTGCFFNF